MNPRSVPELYAIAYGQACQGLLRCYYCGAACDGSHSAADYVRDSFTGVSGVACPGSTSVCAGCVLCLRDAAEITLVNGEVRDMTRVAVRAWSWLITPDSALAASKAHLAEIRAACLGSLMGGDRPWAVVLSDSGQKHLLYRGVVNYGSSPVWSVTLEGERVDYRLDSLQTRLALCGRLVAATGKPALAAPVDFRFAASVMSRYTDGETLVREWDRVRREPLSRLTGWLSPNKEACLELYPSDAPAAADV